MPMLSRETLQKVRRHGSGFVGTLGMELVHTERMLANDAVRDLGNMRASLRTFALTLVVSVLMGAAAWAFLTSLNLVTAAREAHVWLFALLPVVSVATAWVYRNHGLRAARGNNLVIDSSETGTPIHARMAVLTFVCSVATHLAGGSAGREGTAVQIGGTIASNVAGIFHLGGRDRQDLMLAGISAAFGGVFGTPLAGAFFGMEMCTIGKLNYSAGLYCLVASFTGDLVARGLGIAHTRNVIESVPAMEPATVALAVAAAVAFGLVARFFSLAIRTVKRFYAARFTNYLVAAVVGSLVLLAVYVGLGAYAYGGLSEWLVGAGFEGKTGPVDVIMKLACTALTLGAGYQGGEVTPLFGIGAALGGWFGQLAGVEPSFMAALGMIGVFGAALNVPVTTIMLSIDMFGGQAAGYFVIVAFISYLVAGHRGVYPAQRIVTPKRRSLGADQGTTVETAIEQHRTSASASEAEVSAEDDRL
ncbi:chloride channel protein [Collinsella tanakaei]|uniref:chloride channel protein n=1 Tax=Collinsella tanakaei TaxID=626935 RepID=UPI0025A497F3|nr:chloride channel protein [Collinsella tanakaei]MDM8245259.1 chloride channel protein [Collinsella tanakaei]